MNEKNLFVVLLVLTGCAAEEGVREASEELAQVVADAIQAELREHPNHARVLAGLSCEGSQSCSSEEAFSGTDCILDSTGLDDGFRADYLACVEHCGRLEDCYGQAMKERSLPEVFGTEFERCQAAMWDCDTNSDACDAFLTLSEPTILEVLSRCSDSSCQDLQRCQTDALLGDLVLEPE